MAFDSPEFEIEATFTSVSASTSRTTINIHNFTVAKVPFVKFANMTYITVEGDYSFLSLIAADGKSKLEPPCHISIYNLKPNEKNPQNENRGVRSGLLFSSNYIVYSVIDEQTAEQVESDIQIHDQTKIYTFILVSPIIHWLNTNHDYIVASDSGTGSGGISGYESYLISKFKGDSFSFQNLAIDANSFTYDQVLTKSECDLNVPMDLIRNYKSFDTIAYYYHDDFHIGAIVGNTNLTSKGQRNNKAINNIMLSFGSIHTLPSVDLFDKNHTDSRLHATINGVEPGVDMFGKFQQASATITVSTADGHVEQVIPTTIGDQRPTVEPNTVSWQNLTVSTDSEHRVIHGKAVSYGGDPIIPKHYTSMYGPDNIEKATARYHKTRNLITRDIMNYIDMTFQQCYPDLINLTSLYNLDDAARGRFAYLPIAVTNIFHKQQSKDVKLIHSTRAKFIEFYV